MRPETSNTPDPAPALWRVEGNLLDVGALRPAAFFAWNAQGFSERWVRRGALGLLGLGYSVFKVFDRRFALRSLHTLLRGVSRDRLDLLGEEYFHYVLRPRLKPRGEVMLKEWMARGGPVVLVSHALEHTVRPLSDYLGIENLVANRLEFRNGLATGRLLEPIIRPQGSRAYLVRRIADGMPSLDGIARDLAGNPELFRRAMVPAKRPLPGKARALVLFDHARRVPQLSVRRTLAGKHLLLIGATGFIGKVWLVNLLTDLPEIGKIHVLIRRKGPQSALRRFEKIVAESPAFDVLHKRHGKDLPDFLAERIEVVEGDVAQPGLGIAAENQSQLRKTLDVVVNSSGLTEFNPDLRQALAANVDAALHVLDFVERCEHAGLLHLSTCYVVGARDGRVTEELRQNYTPAHLPHFDAERERQALHEKVKRIEARAESPEITAALRRQILEQRAGNNDLNEEALEKHLQKARARWLRNRLIKAGSRRARRLGWPNTYTLTKSLAESLLAKRGARLPVAVVRPSIVETSVQQPFTGWNEGVNTSAPLSYLLGTYFRQLPTNERKCLDLIPVDLVCRGMTLVAAAIVARCHQSLYQLATSADNPCDMRRSIELTSLAHRKHYRAQEGLEHWLRSRFDAIPVSKTRYQRLSAPGQKAVVRILKRLIAPLPFARAALERRERSLERVEKLIELYEPFILHNEHVFEAENVKLLSEALPPEEKEVFGYDARSIDWWEYWINIHVPALRKWVYPLLEGRPGESRPQRVFHLASHPASEPEKAARAAPAS